MEIAFNGKRALVTGTSQGIGRDIALGLAKCGATVVAFDMKPEGLESLKKEIPNLETVCVDLCDWDATKQAAENCLPIDLLVNCAGISSLEPVGGIQESTVDRLFGVNVKAIINLSQVVTSDMKKRKVPGAVVNISSQASRVALPDHVTYNSSKAAVDMITKCMALDLGPYQIRTNAVCPTAVNTELGRYIYKDPVKKAGLVSRIPLGRFAETKDIVGPVLFLLSDSAAMVNGCCFPVDGGATAC